MKKHNLSTKIKILCTLCFLFISTVSCQNNSTSDVPLGTPVSIGDFPLKENWHRDFDNELQAMALGSGVLVTGLTDQNGAVIQAFDMTSGISLWKSNLHGKNNFFTNIVVVDKLVYVIYPPSVFAIDLDTGKLVFENDLGLLGTNEIKAFTDKHIFMVQVSEGVFALDRFTGKLSWQVLLGRGHVDVFSDNTNKLVYIVHGKYIKAVNELDGSLVWQKDIGFHGPVEFYDNFMYYPNSEIENTPETHLQAVNLNTNDILWDFELTREIQCAKVTSESIIAVTDRTIINLDRLSGEKVWEYYTSPYIYCPLIIIDKVIYLKDGYNNQFIAIAKENGNILGKLDFEDSNGIGYAIPGDNLLSSTYPFNMLAVYLKNSVYVYR